MCRLAGNPACNVSSTQKFCVPYNGGDTNVSASSPATSIMASCSENTCDTDNNEELVYGLLITGSCFCAYPLLIGYRLKSPGFAYFAPYENMFQVYLSSGLNLLEYQVNVSDFKWELGPRLAMDIKLFPNNASHRFTDSEVQHLYDTFANWKIPDNNTFGPYEVLSFNKLSYNGKPLSICLSAK